MPLLIARLVIPGLLPGIEAQEAYEHEPQGFAEDLFGRGSTLSKRQESVAEFVTRLALFH